MGTGRNSACDISGPVRERLGVPLCGLRTVLLILRGRSLRTPVHTLGESSSIRDTQSHLQLSHQEGFAAGAQGTARVLLLMGMPVRRL